MRARSGAPAGRPRAPRDPRPPARPGGASGGRCRAAAPPRRVRARPGQTAGTECWPREVWMLTATPPFGVARAGSPDASPAASASTARAKRVPGQARATARASVKWSTSVSVRSIPTARPASASRSNWSSAVCGVDMGTPRSREGSGRLQAQRPKAAVGGRAQPRAEPGRRRRPVPKHRGKVGRDKLRGVHADDQQRAVAPGRRRLPAVRPAARQPGPPPRSPRHPGPPGCRRTPAAAGRRGWHARFPASGRGKPGPARRPAGRRAEGPAGS